MSGQLSCAQRVCEEKGRVGLHMPIVCLLDTSLIFLFASAQSKPQKRTLETVLQSPCKVHGVTWFPAIYKVLVKRSYYGLASRCGTTGNEKLISLSDLAALLIHSRTLLSRPCRSLLCLVCFTMDRPTPATHPVRDGSIRRGVVVR